MTHVSSFVCTQRNGTYQGLRVLARGRSLPWNSYHQRHVYSQLVVCMLSVTPRHDLRSIYSHLAARHCHSNQAQMPLTPIRPSRQAANHDPPVWGREKGFLAKQGTYCSTLRTRQQQQHITILSRAAIQFKQLSPTSPHDSIFKSCGKNRPTF